MKRKKTGGIIAIVVILLVLAVCAMFAWNYYSQIIAEKQAIYDQAEEFFAAGNYRDAYRTYLQAEDFKDAADKAAKTQQLMADGAKLHKDKAQHLSSLKFNTVAGLYLTRVLENAKQFTLEDYNEMAGMIGGFYDLAAQQYAENMAIEDKDLMTLPVMEILMPRIEALGAGRDPAEALDVMSEVTTFSLADQVFLHCWNDGIFDSTTLDTMAELAPVWVPAMDQIIAETENLDVVALVNRS